MGVDQVSSIHFQAYSSIGYLLIWQPCNQLVALARNLPPYPSFGLLGQKLKTFFAPTPCYILGFTEKDPLFH